MGRRSIAVEAIYKFHLIKIKLQLGQTLKKGKVLFDIIYRSTDTVYTCSSTTNKTGLQPVSKPEE